MELPGLVADAARHLGEDRQVDGSQPAVRASEVEGAGLAQAAGREFPEVAAMLAPPLSRLETDWHTQFAVLDRHDEPLALMNSTFVCGVDSAAPFSAAPASHCVMSGSIAPGSSNCRPLVEITCRPLFGARSSASQASVDTMSFSAIVPSESTANPWCLRVERAASMLPRDPGNGGAVRCERRFWKVCETYG